MSTHITKTWFDGEKVVTQEIPEADIYLPDPRWNIELCAAYAAQLRDKTRANTAQHAAEAIEYLLTLAQREWVGLTDDEIQTMWSDHCKNWQRAGKVLISPTVFGHAIEAKLKDKT